MPWLNKQDVLRHNQKAAADPVKEKAWRTIANSALKTHDDASAIRIANASVRKMKQGGLVRKGDSKQVKYC